MLRKNDVYCRFQRTLASEWACFAIYTAFLVQPSLQTIKRVTAHFHGQAIREWISHVVANFDRVAIESRTIIEQFKSSVLKPTMSSVTHNAASRFALCAAAGEMATRAGITGWTEGVAHDSAMVMWESSQQHLAKHDPVALAVDRVRTFIVKHEEQFVSADEVSSFGFLKDHCFHIFPTVFRAGIGSDYEAVAKHLISLGLLVISPADKRHVKKVRINEHVKEGNPIWFYVIGDTIVVR